MSYLSEVLADSPNVYYRMDDPSGTTCTALVGPNAAYVNGPTLGVTGALTASGDTNTAITCSSGATSFAQQSGGNAAFNVGDVFTLEAWVKRTTTGVKEGLISNQASTAYAFYINTSNQIQLDCTAALVDIIHSTTTITDTNWHHCVVTKNGTTRAAYIDGAASTNTPNNTTFGSGGGFNINFGREGSSNLTGSLDEVAIYPTALSLARVQAHYNAAIATAGQTLYPDAEWLDFV